MTERPFRFGVIAGYAPDIGTLTKTAARAEELGFDTLLTPDPVSGEHDPLSALAGVAAVTTRLRFGTFVLAVPYRDRKALAWQARTLNTMSGGRFELGLGAGRPGSEQRTEALGRAYGTAGQRVRELAETVAEIKSADDRPRLLLAAGGPKLLDLAAREADTVTLTWPPRTTEADADGVVQRFRAAAGDRADDIELNVNLISVGDRPSPGTEKFIGATTAELAAAGAITVLPGPPEEAADRLRRWRDRWGVSYITVNSGFMDDLAPVIAKLKDS